MYVAGNGNASMALDGATSAGTGLELGHAMQTLSIPDCIICGSRHVAPLARIARHDAEDWLQCDFCGHVFPASAATETPDVLGNVPDIFSISELSSDERARMASVASERFEP